MAAAPQNSHTPQLSPGPSHPANGPSPPESQTAPAAISTPAQVPSSQQTAAQPQATSGSSPSAPASPNLTQSTSSAPTLAPPSQPNASNIPPTPSSGQRRKRKWAPLARAFSLLFAVACIFVFVSLITNFGQSSYWPLAQLTPTYGILLLSFLSKIIDWGLGLTTDKAWNMLQWGPILRAGSARQKNMLTFLTLGARLDGAIKVLFSRVAWLSLSGNNRGSLGSRIINCAGIWALLKFLVWILAQFPGLIIMAVVEPQTQYIADHFTQVSGGIGIFDPSTIIPMTQGPTIAQYTYRALTDPGISFQTDQAATPECQNNSSCTSYLLTGGIQFINPLPQRKVDDDQLTAYVAKDVPSYQLDTWDLTRTTAEFQFRDCELYKAKVNNSLGFYFCMRDEPDGGILAGYAPCYYWAGPGQCLTDLSSTRAIQLYIWVTKIRFYRLKTSFVADRRTGTILSLLSSSNTNDPPSSSPDPPIFQPIPAASFRKAMDNIICPYQNSTTLDNPKLISGACDNMMPNFLLTDSIANLLATAAGLEFSPGSTILQNLFATVLMLFTPVWYKEIAGANQKFTFSDDAVIPGLPAENYFTGSMARPVSYVAPAQWTVVAFMVCGGVLLLLSAIGMVVSVVVTGGYQTARGATPRAIGETSSFPLVDAGLLDVRENVPSVINQGGTKALADTFGAGGAYVEDRDVIRIAARSEIRMR